MTQLKPHRILIIEDNRVLREGLAAMLDAEPDMRVTASIGSGSSILTNALRSKPQIVLLDVGLRNANELSIVNTVKLAMPDTRIIGMGLIPSQSDIVELIEAGASGFILKEATKKEFIDTVRSVAKGINVLPPLFAGSLFSAVVEYALKRGKGRLPQAVRMTLREREVIALIADGLSNKDIARQLNVSTHTVKSHIHNIMEKLALHTRLQIAAYTRDKEL